MAKTRIMYVEYKGSGLAGDGRIGRVKYSKTGKSVYYGDLFLETLNGTGYKSNYFDPETGAEYWVSGCRKDGNDALYPMDVFIDPDVQEEYWREIRNKPENIGELKFRSHGKHSKGGRHTK